MKDDKHKSVILYAEWKKPLQNLSLEQKGRILDALLDFPDGIIPTFDDPVLQIAWSFMEGGLQENARKWEATRKKRSDAGKKGNESRWHSSEVDSTCRKNRICDTCDDSIAKIAFAILAMILSQTSLFLVLFLFLLKKKVKKKPPPILAQIQALPKSCSTMKRLWERSRALPWTSSKSGRMSIQPS